MESFESLANLAEDLSTLPGHPGLPPTLSLRLVKQNAAVEEAVAKNPGNESAQIDAIAKIQNYFQGEGLPVDIVTSYLGDTLTLADPVHDRLSLADAIQRLAEPIEHSYTTADGGRLFVIQEKVARSQRQYHEPQKALEKWGPEEDLDELCRVRVTEPDGMPTVEGQLWNLYYTILHAAKKIAWDDEQGQQKLVSLLAGLKARPDPATPTNMTIALKRNWIYEPGQLWSGLVMLGPSARESWNDCPGGGAGWHPVEVKAWTNVNAFIARVTAQGLADFTMYGVWALDEALMGEIKVNEGSHRPAPSREYMADALFRAAAVWIRLAGKHLLRKSRESVEEGAQKIVTPSKWEKWLKIFEEEAKTGRYTVTVSQIAKDCAQLMSQFEKELLISEATV